MRRATARALITFVTFLGLGSTASITASENAEQPTMVILGSSTAGGAGATNYDSSFAGRYTKYLATQSPPWKMVNLAVGGFTTYHVMPTGYKPPAYRAQPDPEKNITKAISLHPKILLISLPSNDINSQVPAVEYNANFDSLKAWGERAGIVVWIGTPLPRSTLDDPKLAMLIALRDRILSRYAPRALNFYDSLGGEDGRYYSDFNAGDGVHTNNRGHKILYDRMITADVIGVKTTGIFANSSDRNLRKREVTYGLPKLILNRSGRVVFVEFNKDGRMQNFLGRSLNR